MLVLAVDIVEIVQVADRADLRPTANSTPRLAISPAVAEISVAIDVGMETDSPCRQAEHALLICNGRELEIGLDMRVRPGVVAAVDLLRTVAFDVFDAAHSRHVVGDCRDRQDFRLDRAVIRQLQNGLEVVGRAAREAFDLRRECS